MTILKPTASCYCLSSIISWTDWRRNNGGGNHPISKYPATCMNFVKAKRVFRTVEECTCIFRHSKYLLFYILVHERFLCNKRVFVITYFNWWYARFCLEFFLIYGQKWHVTLLPLYIGWWEQRNSSLLVLYISWLFV